MNTNAASAPNNNLSAAVDANTNSNAVSHPSASERSSASANRSLRSTTAKSNTSDSRITTKRVSVEFANTAVDGSIQSVKERENLDFSSAWAFPVVSQSAIQAINGSGEESRVESRHRIARGESRHGKSRLESSHDKSHLESPHGKSRLESRLVKAARRSTDPSSSESSESSGAEADDREETDQHPVKHSKRKHPADITEIVETSRNRKHAKCSSGDNAETTVPLTRSRTETRIEEQRQRKRKLRTLEPAVVNGEDKSEESDVDMDDVDASREYVHRHVCTQQQTDANRSSATKQVNDNSTTNHNSRDRSVTDNSAESGKNSHGQSKGKQRKSKFRVDRFERQLSSDSEPEENSQSESLLPSAASSRGRCLQTTSARDPEAGPSGGICTMDNEKLRQVLGR